MIHRVNHIFHQISQIFSNMLELIDSRFFQIARVQDLVNEFALHHDLRDVSHRGDAIDLFEQIRSSLGVLLTHEISQFDTVQQRVKANRPGIIRVRDDQWRKLIPHLQGIFVRQGGVMLRVGIQFHIFQVLPNRKVLFVQFLHLANHVVHQRLAECDQIRCLIRKILQFKNDLRL